MNQNFWEERTDQKGGSKLISGLFFKFWGWAFPDSGYEVEACTGRNPILGKE